MCVISDPKQPRPQALTQEERVVALAEFFGVKKFDFQLMQQSGVIKRTVFLTIDVQKEFADPDYSNRGNARTDSVSTHIAELTPQFRQVGFPVGHVYYAQNKNEKPETAMGGFHRIQVDKAQDMLIPKNEDSAFQGGNIKADLNSKGITHLLVSGFNASACVHQSVLGALKHDFNVCVLSDLIGNGAWLPRNHMAELTDMKNNGAHAEESEFFIEKIGLKDHVCACSL